jgi:membrane protein DedA with SNARE-associated domain
MPLAIISNQSGFLLIIAITLWQLITGSTTLLTNLITKYGYLAITALMALESASIPVPSEVIMPLAGLFSANGLLSFPLALIAGMVGSAIGLAVDYYIAYFVGKEVVYKHLQRFHIKKESLESFDEWFERNGFVAVFVTKFIPLVRTLVSFPAGFAKMDAKKFFAYSLLGSLIWNVVLMAFGYYALAANSAVVILASIAAFVIILYFIYSVAIKRMRKG